MQQVWFPFGENIKLHQSRLTTQATTNHRRMDMMPVHRKPSMKLHHKESMFGITTMQIHSNVYFSQTTEHLEN